MYILKCRCFCVDIGIQCAYTCGEATVRYLCFPISIHPQLFGFSCTKYVFQYEETFVYEESALLYLAKNMFDYFSCITVHFSLYEFLFFIAF